MLEPIYLHTINYPGEGTPQMARSQKTDFLARWKNNRVVCDIAPPDKYITDDGKRVLDENGKEIDYHEAFINPAGEDQPTWECEHNGTIAIWFQHPKRKEKSMKIKTFVQCFEEISGFVGNEEYCCYEDHLYFIHIDFTTEGKIIVEESTYRDGHSVTEKFTWDYNNTSLLKLLLKIEKHRQKGDLIEL